MDKDKIIELTNRIYKITLLFPKKEPLRYRIRETADEVLSNLIAWEVFHNPNPNEFQAVDLSSHQKFGSEGLALTPKFGSEGNPKQKDLIFEIKKNYEILRAYFDIVKWQNWVSYFDVLEIEEEYDKIECDLKKEIEGSEKPEKSLKMEFSSKNPEVNGDPVSVANAEKEKLDPRKEKILGFLKEKGRVQVWEIKEILPEVSKRTLRRDFEQLLKQGLVKRIGERNDTFYQLNLVGDSEGKDEA